jgi:hypothetical protein
MPVMMVARDGQHMGVATKALLNVRPERAGDRTAGITPSIPFR